MTVVEYVSQSDPGVGDEYAPPGTVPWAQRVRLSLQGLFRNFPNQVKRIAGYFELVREHRAWTLMNKKDGTFFATFEEFCEHPEPWGLGRHFDAVKPYLQAALGKEGFELETVAPAQEPKPGPGRGKKKTVGNDCPSFSDSRKDKNLRAILRAPEVVQDAYRAGLIGQVDAAKLGPKDPEPEQAAKAVEVAKAIAPIVEKARAAKPRERAKVKREVNAKVREMLGTDKRKTESQPAPYSELIAALSKLDTDHLRNVVRQAQTILAARGVIVSVTFDAT